MTKEKVEVWEYTCEKCGYKWINRKYGKDEPIPERCSKCKKANWDGENISPKERGLRRRVEGLGGLYRGAGSHFTCRLDKVDCAINWSDEITKKFLNLRPTKQELKQVIYPTGLPLKPLNSQNQLRNRGFVPDPNEKNCLIHNPKEYVKLRRLEAQRHQEIMLQRIESRL
jgi:hypothetical protein